MVGADGEVAKICGGQWLLDVATVKAVAQRRTIGAVCENDLIGGSASFDRFAERFKG